MSYVNQEPDAAVLPILENLKRLEQEMRLAGDAGVDVPLPLMRNIKDDLHELNSLLRRRREDEENRRLHTDGRADDAAGGDTACAVQEGRHDAAAPASVASDLLRFDSRLRRCLSCLAAFPPEQRVKKSLLFHWWIGEGIVSSVQEAKECVDQLLAAGLVVPLRRPHCDKAHAFAAHRSLRSHLEAETADAGAMATRLLVTDSRFHPQPQLAGVVTAYNISGRYMCPEKEWMAKQTSMRVLQLGQWRNSPSSASKHHNQHHQRWHIELVGGTRFLESVGACRHSLRYLSLRGVSVVDSLPDQIGELRNLVVLDLHACHNLETLPESVGSLAMLQYVDVSNCYLLDQMPRTISNLSRLQVLKGFVASSHGDAPAGDPGRKAAAALRGLRCGWRTKKVKARSEPCRLRDLTKLRNLRKLRIFNYGASRHADDDNLGHLIMCRELRSLTITWAASASTGTPLPPDNDGQTHTWLQLRKLDLRRMPYDTLPSRFAPRKLKNLKKLCIRGGRLASLNTNDIDGDPTPWKLVETLRLRFLRELECEWETVHRRFPGLRVLEHWQCPNLSKWRCEISGAEELRYVEVNHIQDFFYGEQNLCPWDTECDERGIWRRRD